MAGRGRDGDGVRREGDGTLLRWGGAPIPALKARWNLPLLEVRRTIPSTNDRLKELAERGSGAWSTVVAHEQTAGRGRGTSGWHSPPGLGLWMSVLLPGPAASPGDPPLGPILAGVAVARALEDRAPEARVLVKWPNDLLIGERKVCGILCEGAPDGRIVAGIGVNVAQRPADFPPDLRGRATSLEAEAGRRVPIPALCGSVLARLRDVWSREPAGLEGGVARELRSRDALRGRRVRADGVEGRAVGIGADGALVVETEPGRRTRVVAGGVELAGSDGSDASMDGAKGGGRSCSS